MRILAATAVIPLVFVASCTPAHEEHRAPATSSQTSGLQNPQVPPVAPDSIPTGLLDDVNLRTNAPCVSGKMVRDAILVRFQDGATQRQRQVAIDSVRGKVIGGVRFGSGDGWYVVRVSDDGSGQGLCGALRVLSGMSQVRYAHSFGVNVALHH